VHTLIPDPRFDRRRARWGQRRRPDRTRKGALVRPPSSLRRSLRVSEEEEREGLDISSHGETAYNR